MERLWRWLPQGIALVAPVAPTIARLVWLGSWSQHTFDPPNRAMLPAEWYFLGLGLQTDKVLTLGIGLAASLFPVRWLVGLVESMSRCLCWTLPLSSELPRGAG